MSRVVIELPDDDASELVEAARRGRTTPERLAAGSMTRRPGSKRSCGVRD
jgi:hypothetical protein